MYLLRSDHSVQSSLARDIADGIWQREPLVDSDFERIAVLFKKYRDLPADFADLSLIVISERLNIPQIVTLDSDFNIYQRFRDKPQPFNRVFYPHTKSKNQE
jgi:predicted nucleic acid-binding protein